VSNNSGGSSIVSFPVVGILGVVFVTLKLLGKITWSWLWVTAPFWGSALLVVLLLAAMILAAVLKS
jgi:hypothetical protein